METFQYRYQRKTQILYHFAVAGVRDCSGEDYDRFDPDIPPAILETIRRPDGLEKAERFSAVRSDFASGFDREELFHRKVYLYAEILVKTACKAILNILSSENAKVWVNQRLVSVHADNSGEIHNVVVTLENGANAILMERYDTGSSRFCLQVTDYAFQMSRDLRAYGQENPLINARSLYAVASGAYLPAEDTLTYMLLANDREGFRPDYILEIEDEEHQPLSAREAFLFRPEKIDLRPLRSGRDDRLRHYYVVARAFDLSGGEHRLEQSIVVDAFAGVRDELAGHIRETARGLDAFTGAQLQGTLDNYDAAVESGDCFAQYWNLRVLADLCRSLEEGTYDFAFYKRPGVHNLYFHSDLDDRLVALNVHIPAGYTEEKAYPLIMTLSTDVHSGMSYSFPAEALSEPVIHADVTGRGFTGGSYIGEASTLEVLEFLQRTYAVDEQRIYWIGYSNGGYAVWNMALLYPHVPAAIFPLIGYPNIRDIHNLSNVPCYALVSKKDYVFAGRTQSVNYLLKSFGNYHQYDFSEMIHSHFDAYILSPNILNRLLEYRRELWPRRIQFRTEQNRHLRSFWIRFDGIAYSKKSASVQAEILDSRRINVRIRNVKGFTLALPPIVDRERFTVVINGSPMKIENCREKELRFVKKGLWSLSSQAAAPVDLRKGNGLLDVYLGPLRIVLPDDAGPHLQRAASALASPFTNGGHGVIHAKYPIFAASAAPGQILHHNLIFFDVCGSNSYVRRFQNRLPITCTPAGYAYKEVKYDGPYVVMQVVENPYYHDLSMLVISTNEEALINKVFFLRRFVMPYQMNGFHPFLNNEALIFDDSGYRRIYEWGMDPEEIG